MTAKETPTILYVDDDRTNRVVFEQSFGSDFSVLTAASAKEALEVMRDTPIAVLLSDQRMAEMTGIELLAEVKQRHPAIVRMVVTAYPDLTPVLRAVNEQLVARYIIKPWDHDELLKTLHWGIETFELGNLGSSVQARVFESERLITLGSIQALMMHDLRAPLSYVEYNAQALLHLSTCAPEIARLLATEGATLKPVARDAIERLCEELGPVAEDILAGVRHLTQIVRDHERLLQPSEPPGRTSVSAPIAMLRFAVAIGRSLKHSRASMIVEYDGPDEIPAVQMSNTQLAQVLVNLVSNGVYAVLAKKGTHGSVRVSAVLTTASLQIAVADDGIGMSREVLERLGTPFYANREGGTGLGIAQCKRLLYTVGGTLFFQSIAGQGTTATITIPWA